MATVSKNYAVNANEFKIATDGLAGTAYATIAGVENCEISISATVQKWKEMAWHGFTNALKTGLEVSITMSGKRSYGDAGNDYVCGTAFKLNDEAASSMQWTTPAGEVITFPVCIDVKKIAGGAADDVDAFEAEFVMRGVPTITPKAAG